MKISDATERFLLDRSAYASLKTVEIYRYVLKQFLSYVGESEPLEAVDETDLQKFLMVLRDRPRADRRTGKLSTVTVISIMRHLRAFFHWCVERDLLSMDPAARVKMPRADYRPRSLTLDQVARLIEYVKSALYATAARDLAVIYFLLDSGCRASEVMYLEIQSLNLAEGWADVLGKGNKTRRIAFSTNTALALKDYLNGRSSGKVFLLDDGTPMAQHTLREIFKRLQKQVGFHLNPHLFRHTFATLFIASGGDPSHAQTLLGHSSIEMTMRYAAGARTVAAVRAGHAYSVVSALEADVSDKPMSTPNLP